MADRFYRCSVEYSLGGLKAANTFCIFGDDSSLDWSPLNAQGLADKLATSTGFTNAFRGCITSGCSLTGVTVREMLPPGSTAVADYGVHALSLAGANADSTLALPAQLCGIVAMKSGLASRSANGYMAIPFTGSSASINGGVWNTSGNFWAGLTNLITELGHWNHGGSSWLSGSSWGIGTYSRTKRLRGAPAFAFHTTSYAARPAPRWRESRQS